MKLIFFRLERIQFHRFAKEFGNTIGFALFHEYLRLIGTRKKIIGMLPESLFINLIGIFSQPLEGGKGSKEPRWMTR
jgi:hypothetical protein